MSRIPSVGDDGVRWELNTGSADPFGLRCVLAWAHLQEPLPGRLRPCANDDCRLFLVDRSRANARRWCSMATCGNRLKARRHHRRATGRDDNRAATADDEGGGASSPRVRPRQPADRTGARLGGARVPSTPR